MSYGIALSFEGIGEDKYWAVNQRLGIDREGKGTYPDGLVCHAGGPTATGWLVLEVWESKASQEAFMAAQLGAALGAEELPSPTIIESDLVNVMVAG